MKGFYTVRKILTRLLPGSLVDTLVNYQILSRHYGQFRTMRTKECVRADGSPIPWYTYPAIEYLERLDFSGMTVFEYGSGNSTLFWAQRAKSVVSVETSENWYQKIRGKMPANVNLVLHKKQEDFIASINAFSNPFDVIVIDGQDLLIRKDCARHALEHLSPEGFIILDNSDWLPGTSKLLREANLIQVDLSGFAPINGYTSTTSFFLSRKVRLTPLESVQPGNCIGGKPYNMDSIPEGG